MLITVTTTNQTLDDILSAGQKTTRESVRDAGVQSKFIIQVLGPQNVYIEAGAAATVAGGLRLAQGNSLSLDFYDLREINLISEGANNADVRLLFS